jgi:hypothetical protein
MSGLEKQIYADMIEADLQLAWEHLGNDQFDLMVHHFEAATTKGKELRDMAKNEPPKPEQPILDV